MTTSGNETDDLPPTTITTLAYGVFPSFALLSAMQLDLFTRLSEGATTRQALAQALDVNPEKLVALLDLLVASGLLVREGERIENSAEADRYLVCDRPDSRLGMAAFFEGLWRAALNSAETIRSGKPASHMDFAGLDEEALLAFFQRQFPSSLAGGRELATMLEPSRYSHVADLGGGTGGTSIGLCSAAPALRSTVYDLPSVVPVAKRFISEAGLEARIDVVAADLVAGKCRGEHDVAILRSVLQVLDPDSACAVLRNAYEVLRAGGELILAGSVLKDSRDAPGSALARGLVFLNVYEHGGSYTESEHFSWLAGAGFVNPQIDYACMRDGTSVIRATRP